MNDPRFEWLLQCLIHVLGRIAIKREDVENIVGSRKKQIQAFNLCDGTQTLSSIAKKLNLDNGNLSRCVDRWIQHGIIFKYEEGKEVRPLHIFPIPLDLKKKK